MFIHLEAGVDVLLLSSYVLFFRGIIKNRPALGERALQELKDDNLLKFTYFLTDIRGRNVRSYMKVPVPSIDDPVRKEFLNTLNKHDINIDEYASIYEKSSIPSNNNLSMLSVQIFQTNAALVSQYQKYQTQLHSVIRNHIENGNIEQLDNATFTIINSDAFHHTFANIQNVSFVNKTDKNNRQNQPLKLLQPTTNANTTESAIEFRRSTVINKVMINNATDKENHTQAQHVEDMLDGRKTTETQGIYLKIS